MLGLPRVRRKVPHVFLVCQTDPSTSHPGESWLWENPDEFRVVIDMGDHEPFAQRAAAFEPDVLILTHDDDDHVGSALSFFKYRAAQPPAPSTRRSSLARPTVVRKLEVWVPYDWLRLGLVASEVQFEATVGLGLAGSSAAGDNRAVGDASDEDPSDPQVAVQLDDSGADERGDGDLRSFIVDDSVEGLTFDEAWRNQARFGHTEAAAAGYVDRDPHNEAFELPLPEPRFHDGATEISSWEENDPTQLRESWDAAQDQTEPESPNVGSDGLPDHIVAALAAIGTGIDLGQLAKLAELAVEKERTDNLKEIGGRRKWVGSHKQVGQRIAQTAAKISAIILAAHEAGATFRFFDPDRALLDYHRGGGSGVGPVPWKSQGIRGIVTIVNAVQVRPQHRRSRAPASDLIKLAYITVQNRRALVTFLWPKYVCTKQLRRPYPLRSVSGASGGVLIWSDSEHRVLTEKPNSTVIPWCHISVMSAPHHASRDLQHVDIWQERPRHVSVLLSHNSEPDTTEFTRIPNLLRDCTKCAKYYGIREVSAVSWDGLVERDWQRRFSLTGFCDYNHR